MTDVEKCPICDKAYGPGSNKVSDTMSGLILCNGCRYSFNIARDNYRKWGLNIGMELK